MQAGRGRRGGRGVRPSLAPEFNWCVGRVEESNAIAGRAVELLERHPPGEKLVFAYARLSWSHPDGEALARHALDIATEIDNPEAIVAVLARLGEFDRALALGREHGLVKSIGATLSMRGNSRFLQRDYDAAEVALDESLSFTSEHGLELYRVYDQAFRARLDLVRGRWAEAADMAEAVLRQRRASTAPRVFAQVVLGLVRLRRGDPGWEPLLDEAWALAQGTELFRIVPAAAARAEAAWLANDPDGVAAATDPVLALPDGSSAFAVEIAAWRRRAGLDAQAPRDAPEPYASELRGDWASAAERWRTLGCPYEAALALAEADDEEPLRLALDELQRLGAAPAAALVAARLRKQGAKGVPRGPRASTRNNPAGLTAREVEVLTLVAEGLRDADIAKRLVLSERTVGHHVSSILRKLEVRTRAQAGAEAVRLGLAQQDR